MGIIITAWQWAKARFTLIMAFGFASSLLAIAWLRSAIRDRERTIAAQRGYIDTTKRITGIAPPGSRDDVRKRLKAHADED